MSGRAWAIKLGSGGRCIPFCAKHSIVGIGWRDVQSDALISDSKSTLLQTLASIRAYEGVQDKFGQWAGSLSRFGSDCQVGDFVLYYSPAEKHVRICKITSAPKYRDFDLDAEDTHGEVVDIWHYGDVQYACAPIPILDFYGGIKGKLLGPRGTFWQLHDQFEVISQIAEGIQPGKAIAKDSAIQRAKARLEELIVARTSALNERDWELLAADYFRAQGAKVDERGIGKNRAVIDFEAAFEHGDIPASVWRVQVKRYDRRAVSWNEISQFADHAGDAYLCFVSVFGFEPEATEKAEAADILLLQAEDFSDFILKGNLRESLNLKLSIPD